MEKLTFLGVGPKIGRITLPYLVITILLTTFFPAVFTFGILLKPYFLVAGIVFLVIALVYYISTVSLLLPGIRANRLATKGAYGLSRNPLYAALLLFLVPGIGMVLNSWIIMTTAIVGYLAFRKFIHEEEELLERIFGEEFRNYRRKTSLFLPNPYRKK